MVYSNKIKKETRKLGYNFFINCKDLALRDFLENRTNGNSWYTSRLKNLNFYQLPVTIPPFSWAIGRTGKKKRSSCSLKSQYQPCGYVPAQASDDGKSAMTSCGTAATPQWDGSLCRCSERSLLTGKRGQLPFLPRPWPEYYDTQYRLPTRQMGWPTLGCNQQDPWGASEWLVNCKPACMVPKVAGGRAANTAHQ